MGHSTNVYRKNASVDVSAQWRRRLDASRQNREAHAVQWRENKALLIGRGGVRGFKRGEIVNLAWAAFQTMVGTVYAQNPRPVIRGKLARFENVARMLTDVVVSDLEDMRARNVVRLCIQDVFTSGYGLVVEKLQSDTTSVVYRYTDQAKEDQKDDGKDAKKDKKKALEQREEARIAEDEDREPPKAETIEVPVNQRYSLHRAHPESVLFDSVASMADLSDSDWLGLEFYPTKQELKDDPLFTVNEEMLDSMKTLSTPPAMDEKKVGVEWTNQKGPLVNQNNQDDDSTKVRCIELWDRIGRQKFYFAEGLDEVLGKEPWPIELRLNGELQFPATMLYFNENPDELYPIPEISMIAPQIKQFAVLYKFMLKQAVTKWRKHIVRGDVFQKGHISKLLTDEQDSILVADLTKIPGGDKIPLSECVAPVVDGSVDRDIVAISGMVKQQLHEIVGAGDFASGGMRNTRSATEAAALSDFLRTRMTTRTENMDAFFKSLITKHVLFLQETLTDQRSIQTTDEQGLQVWQQYSKENIQGLFAFSVVAGSSMPSNTETRRQESIAFFQQVAPIIQSQGGDLKPMIHWIAPFMGMPGYMVDESFNGSRQALQQLALLFAAAHAGAQIPGATLMEAISAAVNTGLSQADIQGVMQAGQQAAAAQPVSPAGTNTSNQTQ